MPKMKKGVYESPQTAPDGLATGTFGGKSPGAKEVIKSANARSEMRHAPKSPTDTEADSLFPPSGGQSIDKDGIKNTDYITKKGLEFGAQAMYNSLPPGMDLDDQENADIRQMPMRTYEGGVSYPTDGGFGQVKTGIK
jgi:hypothetical protein